MGWVKQVPLPHDCDLPEPVATPDFGWGSVWMCDVCGAKYTLLQSLGQPWHHGDGVWWGSPKPRPLDIDEPEYDYPEKDPLPFWRRW